MKIIMISLLAILTTNLYGRCTKRLNLSSKNYDVEKQISSYTIIKPLENHQYSYVRIIFKKDELNSELKNSFDMAIIANKKVTLCALPNVYERLEAGLSKPSAGLAYPTDILGTDLNSVVVDAD